MKIEISKEKCGNAMDCRVCLNVCPARLFFIIPWDETSIIVPLFLSKCIECDLCVEKCPNDAITFQH